MGGTLSMLEIARKTGVRFVYAGSSTADDVNLSPYAFTKHEGERLCRMYSRVYGVPTVILRFYNVYGPRQLEAGEFSTVIGIFEKQMREGVPLTITGDGEQRWDFAHVEDIVTGLMAASHKKWSGEKFNLGSGKNYSINEVATLYCGDARKFYLPKRPGEVQTTLADIFETTKQLDWRPQIDLEPCVAHFLQNLK